MAFKLGMSYMLMLVDLDLDARSQWVGRDKKSALKARSKSMH